MNKYLIRFNKTRGMEGRGTSDHAWIVLENTKQYIVKNIKINVSSYGENIGPDWFISCSGFMKLDRETSTIYINETI
jgi:hypothetical protein